jgi:putative transposase
VSDACRFIAAEKANYPISLMSRMLGVSRQAFHAWERRPPSQRALEDAFLTARIREIHRSARGVYGCSAHPRRAANGARRQGRPKAGGAADARGRDQRTGAQKRGRTTIRATGVRVADDLVGRDFRPAAPNVLWVADITYLRSWEGWVYLAAVQDAFSRRIVGWAMAEHMRADLVLDALAMALARRKPEGEVIHHSDQGSQYVSLAFGQKARDAGIAISMGSRGDCFDNAVAESFFATLKKELVRRRSWPNRCELQKCRLDYIETFYNRERRHSTLGYLSPREFEMISLPQQIEKQKVKPWPVARSGDRPMS